jgi:hypothetical protein
MRIDKTILIGLALTGTVSLIARGSPDATSRPPARKAPVDWSNKTELIVRKLNDPNPYAVVEFLKYLEAHGFEPSHFEQCRDYRWHTIEEILRSQSLDRERHYVMSFLNRFSKETYEPNEKRWIRRLSSMKYVVIV